MNKKIILPIAIIASLPFVANAENISGAMYAAPVHETQQTPAPTTNSYSPFGRVNIDTDDQDHIATTAYVKGAYNSAIAAVNSMQLLFYDPDEDDFFPVSPIVIGNVEALGDNSTDQLVTGRVILDEIDSRRVEIYTTWDTNDTTGVSLKTVYDF